jgi:hypothetical protein
MNYSFKFWGAALSSLKILNLCNSCKKVCRRFCFFNYYVFYLSMNKMELKSMQMSS